MPQIKILATQTARATEEIGGHIAAVQKASGDADGRIVHMKEAFLEMHAISREIADALDSQVAATNGIVDLVENALDGADAVAMNTGKLVESARSVDSAAGVVLVQSGALNQQISGLTGEVASFLRFLAAA